MPTVTVNGIGDVEFPDSMSQEQITAVLREKFPSQQKAPFNKPQAPLTLGVYETPTGRPDASMGYAPKPFEGGGAGFIANLKAGIPSDHETRRQIMERETGKQAGFVDGRLATVEPGGGLAFADSGGTSKAGALAASIPEFIGGIVGSAASPVVGTAVGATAGKGFKQLLSNFLFDEPQTALGNAGELALEGGINLATGGLAKGASSLYNRAAVRNAEKFDLDSAVALRDRLKLSTGIDLDLAQTSQVRQVRDLKKWASKYPGDAAELIEALDEKQTAQAADAVQRIVLGKLSAQGDRAALAGSGVETAKAAISAAKLAREQQTRDLYKAADATILDGNIVNGFKQNVYAEQKLREVLADKLQQDELAQLGIPPNQWERSVKVWDLVRRSMRDEQEGAIVNAPNRARMIDGQAQRIQSKLESVSPAYAIAMDKWGRLSKELVEPLEKGTVGVLSKVEGPGAARLVSTVMDDLLADPNATRAVKKQILAQAGGEQAWRDIVKLRLSDALDKAAKETQKGEPANLPGKFRQALVGTPQRERAMYEAIGGEAQVGFNDLMGAFKLLAQDMGSRGGSDTAFNQAITAQQKGGLASSALRTATSPLRAVEGWIDGRMLEANSTKIAEAITDPEKLAALKELRKMRPSRERALAVLAVFGLGQPANAGASAVVNPAPRNQQPGSPPRAQQ